MKMSRCCTCGHEWPTGTDGSHSCAQVMQIQITELRRGRMAYNAVITYMLGEGYMEEPMEFLRCWNEGDFDALRRLWPDAPQAIYFADPLADHEAIVVALNQEE